MSKCGPEKTPYLDIFHAVFMLNDYEIYYKDLLKKSGNPSMNLWRIRLLCIEIYKTINNLKIKNLFKVRKTNRTQREQYKLNLEMPKSNQVSFGTKSLHMQCSRVWNASPFYIKLKEIFRLLNM